MSLYRSPSQDKDDFETFMENLELNFHHTAEKTLSWWLFLVILTQSQNLGLLMTALTLKVRKLTLTYSHQIITKPTHPLNNSSFCIDLIFTTQSNLVMESGVHSSLHADCHHQLPSVKFNLIFFYPPPYEWEVWHYKLTNSDCIQRAIKKFDWEKAFLNIDAKKKVWVTYCETIVNFIRSFIPHETVTCDDRDPPWMTSLIKKGFGFVHFKVIWPTQMKLPNSNISQKLPKNYLALILAIALSWNAF